MGQKIEKVAVLGAGVMGAAIAAHVANAGIPVVLLDIVPKDAQDRNAIAKGAVAKMLKAKPAPFMHTKNASLIECGNLEDDLDKLGECDWIVEAVIERLDIKHQVYANIDKTRKKGSVVSSNTSTIPLDKLTEGQSDQFKKDFMVTHFFNPPRYMRLLEIVQGKNTRQDAVDAVRDFADVSLGKTVVDCHDTPGFIANRIGVYWITAGINEAIDRGITVEEADVMLSRPIGVPKTGVFGLVDLVGIDLMPHLSKSLLDTLPKEDPYRDLYRDLPLIDAMIADGYTGRKGKGGFYRLDTTEGRRQKQAKDLKSGDYADAVKPKLNAAKAGKKGLLAVVEHGDEYADYVWAVMGQTLHYAASLLGTIADDIVAIDDGLKMGFNWKFGPFELMDQLGTEWLAKKWAEEGKAVPEIIAAAKGNSLYRTESGKLQFIDAKGAYHDVKRPEGVVLLSDIKRAADNTPLAKNGSASLWDIGDGVMCIEFHTKMNAMDQDIFAMYGTAMQRIGDGQGDWKALVIHNEGTNFSAGANLGLALFALNIGLFNQIEDLVTTGQSIYKSLKYAPYPVVAAPSGLCLGGGCEILLHCDAVCAHAESYIGLVEVGVGLLPGWGGSKEMLLRNAEKMRAPNGHQMGGPMAWASKAFETISLAKVGTSAQESMSLLYLRKGQDEVVMNRDRLLYAAKQKALELAKDYQAPDPEDAVIKLPGASGKLALNMAVEGFHKSGKATDHDVVVSDAVASVLTGGDTDPTEVVTEDEILKLEKDHFMALIRTKDSLARIEHMLETGKPLRN